MATKKKKSAAPQNNRRAGDREIEIGQRIRAHRLAAGVSQEGLARALGVTFQQVQKYERGVNRVSVSRLMDIAAALGRPLLEFVPETTRGKANPNAALQMLSTPEGQELANLFVAITSRSVRRRVVDLTRALADD